MNEYQIDLCRAHTEACAVLAPPTASEPKAHHVMAVRALWERVICGKASIFRTGKFGWSILRVSRHTALQDFEQWIKEPALTWPKNWQVSRQILLDHLQSEIVKQSGQPTYDDFFEHVLGDPKCYKYVAIEDQRNDGHYSGVGSTLSGEASVQEDGTVVTTASIYFDPTRSFGAMSLSVSGGTDSAVTFGPKEAPVGWSLEIGGRVGNANFSDGTSISALNVSGDAIMVQLDFSERYRSNKKDQKEEEMAIVRSVMSVAGYTGNVEECTDEGLADVIVGDWLVQVTRLKLEDLYRVAATTGTGATKLERSDLVAAFQETIRAKTQKQYPDNERQILVVDLTYAGLTLDQVIDLNIHVERSPKFAACLIGARHWTDVVRLW